MSVPSDTKPIEDKYAGQTTEELLADDTTPPEIDLEESAEDTEKPEDLLEEKAKDDKEKEAPEDDEEKIDLEEEPEEKIDEPVFPVPRKVILAKYPNLFKDFPHLEKSMFRDKAYTELIGSVEDARELVDAKERLDNIQQDVFNGNIADLLTEVKKNDENAFYKVVDNYLPALLKADQGAYLTVISNVGKAIISDFYNAAVANNNEEGKAAAVALHKHLFPGMNYQPPQRLAKEESKTDDTVKQQQEAFANQQYQSALGDVVNKTSNTLRATIDTHIDPKGQMTAYEKKGAVQDALNEVYEQIANDSYFRPYYDKLWKKAFESGFNRNDMELIRKNYLARAKVLLPQAISKIRQEVLKANKTSREDNKDRKGPVRPGRVASPSTKETSKMSATEKAKLIPKNMTSADYLNQD